MTESAQQALSILRDGSQFQWYVIPLFAFVVYVYANEVEKKNWKLIFAGLAFWVHDMKTTKSQLTTLGVIYGVDIAAILIFGVILGWL